MEWRETWRCWWARNVIDWDRNDPATAEWLAERKRLDDLDDDGRHSVHA
jgi:hypothetical protein